jgi:glycosyltransferase involved in cell wall biosynthesis
VGGYNLKIAIYTIAKNEEQNVDSFMSGANEADYIVILDTGSTDKTVEKFKKYPKVIIVQEFLNPFKFDEARNKALDLVPEDVDICISIDLDETIESGWRDALENEWKKDTDVGNYWYWGLLNDKGESIVECWRTKIHSRKGFRWKRSIHEMISSEKEFLNEIRVKGMIVKHHRKHPSNYKKQLDEYIKENPLDAEAYLQRAGDRMDAKDHKSAMLDNLKYLELTEKNDKDTLLIASKRAITCIAIAKCAYALKENVGFAIKYLLKAASEFPNMREPWIYLADAYSSVGEYPLAYGCVIKGLSIEDSAFVKEKICWGDYPHQLKKECLEKIKGDI